MATKRKTVTRSIRAGRKESVLSKGRSADTVRLSNDPLSCQTLQRVCEERGYSGYSIVVGLLVILLLMLL